MSDITKSTTADLLKTSQPSATRFSDVAHQLEGYGCTTMTGSENKNTVLVGGAILRWPEEPNTVKAYNANLAFASKHGAQALFLPSVDPDKETDPACELLPQVFRQSQVFGERTFDEFLPKMVDRCNNREFSGKTAEVMLAQEVAKDLQSKLFATLGNTNDTSKVPRFLATDSKTFDTIKYANKFELSDCYTLDQRLPKEPSPSLSSPIQ